MIKKFKIISMVAAVLFGGQVTGSGSDVRGLLNDCMFESNYDGAMKIIDETGIDPNTWIGGSRFINRPGFQVQNNHLRTHGDTFLAHVCHDSSISCEKKLSLVKQFIEQGGDVNHKFSTYPLDRVISPLCTSTQELKYSKEEAEKIGKYRPVMEYLLEKGANVSPSFLLLALFGEKEDREIMLRYKSAMLYDSMILIFFPKVLSRFSTQKAMEVMESLIEYKFNFEAAFFITGEERLPYQPHIPGKTLRLFEEISRRSGFTFDMFKLLINQGGVDFNNYDKDKFIRGLLCAQKNEIKAYIEEHFPS